MVNLVIAFGAGASLPSARTVLTAAVVGFLGYDVSLVLFIPGTPVYWHGQDGRLFFLSSVRGSGHSHLRVGRSLDDPIAGYCCTDGTWRVVVSYEMARAHTLTRATGTRTRP